MRFAKSLGPSFTLLIVLLFSVGLFLGITNPSERIHRARIDRELFPGMRFLGEVAAIGDGSPGPLRHLRRAVRRIVINGAMEKSIESIRGRLTYHNYLLFSTMTLDEEAVSVGFLGSVRVVFDRGKAN